MEFSIFFAFLSMGYLWIVLILEKIGRKKNGVFENTYL